MKKMPLGICTIEAPCKINLHLCVGERRPDGFHTIESLFASLALSDSIRLELSGNDGENLLYTNWEGPGEEIPKD